jgi:hypothetical protein
MAKRTAGHKKLGRTGQLAEHSVHNNVPGGGVQARHALPSLLSLHHSWFLLLSSSSAAASLLATPLKKGAKGGWPIGAALGHTAAYL